MAGQLFSIQAFNADGTFAPGAKVRTFRAGTTTPQSLYADEAGTIPLANPLVLNAAGIGAAWAKSGGGAFDYKFDIVSNDNSTILLPTIDNYTPNVDNIYFIIGTNISSALAAAQDAQEAAELAQALAETAATNAAASAGTATTQAGIATTQATTATTQAGISTAQAVIATTQAGIATTQAGIATTQAGNAATAAAAALVSENAAELAQTLTQAYADADVNVPVEGQGILTFNPATAVVLATNVITINAHGILENDQVTYRHGGGTAMGGLTHDAEYFAVSTTTNTLALSLTRGGAAVDITSVGTGTAHELLPVRSAKHHAFYAKEDAADAYADAVLTAAIRDEIDGIFIGEYANAGAAITAVPDAIANRSFYFNTTDNIYHVITVVSPPASQALASVPASQAEAEAGSNSTKTMTPLRVAQFDSFRRDTLAAKVYGAIGDNVAINNTALAALTAAIVTNFGGQAYLNLGTYRVNGTTPPVVLKEATTLIGAGPTASRINAADMTAGSVVSHTPDGGSGNSSFISVRNILIDEAFDSAIDFVGMDHSVIDFNFIDSTAARTVRGIRLRDTFMMDVANNHIRETSGAGIDIDNVNIAVSTSILLRLNHLKTTGGYRLRRLTYATDLNSGDDDSNSYSRDLQNVNQMTFVSPGAERSQRAMFNFEASNAIASGVNSAVQDVRATIIAPVALETGQILTEPGFIRAVSADSREIKVAVIGGFYRRQSGNTAPAVSLDGANVKVALIGSTLDASVAPSVTNGAGLYELDWRTGAFHLEVTGGGANNAVLELFNKDDATNAGMLFKTGYSNASARNWGIFINRHVNGDLCLVQSTALGGDPSTAANGVTHLLLHNGRMAIGKTTAPNVALDVVGAGAFTGALTADTLTTVNGVTVGTALVVEGTGTINTESNSIAALTLANIGDFTNHGIHFTTTNTNGNSRNWAIVTSGSGIGRLDFRVGTAQGNSALTGGTSSTPFSMMNNATLLVSGTQVLSTRRTGWGAPTGTATRTTFATTTVTLEQLAQRVKGLVDDLTTHGLIGA